MFGYFTFQYDCWYYGSLLNYKNLFFLSVSPKMTLFLNMSDGLYQLALDLVESPEEIAWLDLSFNSIHAITDDMLE